MRTLAVDPGYDRLGIALFDDEKLIGSECFQTDKKDEHHVRLTQVGKHIRECIKTNSPDFFAIEELFFSKNQKTALKVAEVRGILLYEASRAGLTIAEYKPSEIKIAVTGHGSSDKKQVTAMTQTLTGKKDKCHDDEYDAIAVGLTHNASFKFREARKNG